jgi:hypothetical protein
MSKIYKKVDRNIPVTERTQEFTGADCAEGDVLMVKESLGKHASSARLRTIGGSAKIRFNVYQTVFSSRPADSLHAQHLPNVQTAQEYKISEPSIGDLIIEANTVYEIDRRFPIKDVEIITMSGDINFLFA